MAKDKFRVRLLNDDNKQVKQKTFMADGWDAAEEIAHDFWWRFDKEAGTTTAMTLSILIQE